MGVGEREGRWPESCECRDGWSGGGRGGEEGVRGREGILEARKWGFV